jgi:GT2 family glycosyltransferase
VNTAVCAVIVRFRGGDEVRRCLASIGENGGEILRRIVLVDSGSGDEGALQIAADFPSVKVLPLSENRGFAHAVNRGAEEGDEPLLLLLNPDTEVTVGAVDALASLLENRPRAAGAVPLLEGMAGEAQHHWQLRRLPTVFRLAFGLPGSPAFRRPPETPTTVAQPAAAAWLVRRTVWQALDGFDTGFVPAWWEDVDFCARLQDRLGQQGFPATEGFVAQPSSRIRHIGGSSVAGIGDTAFLTAYNVNLLRYAARHHRARLSTIRATLRLTLALRSLLRPHRREAYLVARDSVKRAS